MTKRRTFLKGIAATLALPVLPSMGREVSALAPIKRLGFIYIPNGVNIDYWFSNDQTTLKRSLEPLAPLSDHFSILRNLECQKAYANGDGAGDHARANAAFLTCRQPKKTAGADIQAGASIDQLAAKALGYQTRFPSLELSTAEPRRSGRCDSGYSCAYQYNLSWLNETTPAPAENNPRHAFEKLFGSGNREADLKRLHTRKSVLDFVKGDAAFLQKRVGKDDQEKLEEYLTSVRELEQRIESAETHEAEIPEGAVKPDGIPDSYRDYIRLQFEIMRLAYQTDMTRISTFVMGMEGSNRAFPEIGVYGKHHNLSHHRGSEESLRDIAKIDLFYAQEFARFLQTMQDTPDGEDSTLLDNSMLLYGGGIRDGNKHNHSDLPLILAGHGGEQFDHGKMKWASENTPISNLYLALLDEIGVNLERFGDSTGRVKFT